MASNSIVSKRHSLMRQMARSLASHPFESETDLLESATASAVELIPGAECCAITLVSKKEITSVAPTDPTALRLDELQMAAGEGPCLQAASEWGTHIVSVRDYHDEKRWPGYISVAAEQTYIRSTVAFQLYRADNAMGALNVHCSRPGAFTAESVEIGLAVATHAALALFGARREIQFASALASRDTIGQAKGMVMERFNVDALQAWELLRKLSQDANIAVFTLAQQLIEADHPLRVPKR